MGATGERIRRGLRAAFGQVSWQPPQWVSSSASLRARSWRSGCERRSGQSASSGHYRCKRARPRRRGRAAVALVREPAAPGRSHVRRDCAAGHVLRLRSAAAAESAARAIRRVDCAARARRSHRRAGAGRHLDEPAARRPMDVGRRQDRCASSPRAIGRSASTSKCRWRAETFAAAHVRLHDYRFEFDSPAFVAKVATTEFHQDPVVAANKKVVVNVAFTHPVDPRQLRAPRAARRCSSASPTRSRRS